MKEQDLHKQVTQWLRLQHREVIFHTDFASGCKLTIGQAVKNKSLQSGKSWPDLFIPEPRGNYHGLFIEIKPDIKKVYKKDMSLVKNERIEDQAEMLTKLQERGYKAVFGCGYEHCVQLINDYLKSA